MNKFKNLLKLLVSVVICVLAGVVGSFFTVSQISGWYAGLNKPFFNPPSWIFGPVWTTIFILMGISLYLIWIMRCVPKNRIKLSNKKPWNKYTKKFYDGLWKKENIILIFSIQLILNVLWSVIFFGAHNIGLAFFELIMLWFAIIFTIINFYRVSRAAALLLLPYILWVSFAGVLNFFIWVININ